MMFLLLFAKVANDVGHEHVKVEAGPLTEAHEGIAEYGLHAAHLNAVVDVIALDVLVVGVLDRIAVLFLAVA
jgi:hypothetical protein